jgi:hypothetical protein
LRTLSLCTCCRHYPGAAAGRRLRSSRPVVSAFDEPAIGSACTSVFSRIARRSLALRPAHSHRHLRDGYPRASDISSPPCLPRLLPAGAFGRVGLTPTGKRRLCTAHADNDRSPNGRTGGVRPDFLNWGGERAEKGRGIKAGGGRRSPLHGGLRALGRRSARFGRKYMAKQAYAKQFFKKIYLVSTTPEFRNLSVRLAFYPFPTPKFAACLPQLRKSGWDRASSCSMMRAIDDRLPRDRELLVDRGPLPLA